MQQRHIHDLDRLKRLRVVLASGEPIPSADLPIIDAALELAVEASQTSPRSARWRRDRAIMVLAADFFAGSRRTRATAIATELARYFNSAWRIDRQQQANPYAPGQAKFWYFAAVAECRAPVGASSVRAIIDSASG